MSCFAGCWPQMVEKPQVTCQFGASTATKTELFKMCNSYIMLYNVIL